MSWFKKKDTSSIPPVKEQARSDLLGTAPAGRARSVSPGPERNADPYARPTPNRYGSADSAPGIKPAPAPGRDKFNRNNPVGDAYSRGQADVDQDRAQLFSGYDPEKQKPLGRFTDGPSKSYAGGEEDDEEDEVETIKKSTRFVKQESVASSRNALRMAREAEETARNTLTRLGDQSEMLAKTERHLDVSKGHVNRVEDKQVELKQLNRSIFRPVITFNKEGKRAAQEEKLLRRHEDERTEHERAMLDIRDSQKRIGRAQGYREDDEDDDENGIGGYGSGRFKAPVDQAQRKAERSQYQFEATASDDELEDELDDNLNEISDMAKRLKALGSAMGDELDNQNDRLNRMGNKVDTLDNKLIRGTERFAKIK